MEVRSGRVLDHPSATTVHDLYDSPLRIFKQRLDGPLSPLSLHDITVTLTTHATHLNDRNPMLEIMSNSEIHYGVTSVVSV